MSATSSPRKLGSKPSLSILSSTALNQLNNTGHDFKPIKERVISESTGLIKFSLGRNNAASVANSSNVAEGVDENYQAGGDVQESPKHAMPIYVPIDNKQETSSPTEQDLLFQMASKQRTILELTAQLKQANEELHNLEEQYKLIAYRDISQSPKRDMLKNQISNKGTSTVRKSTSIMNLTLNPPLVNTEQFVKTQKQVTDTFNQISNNIQNSEFLNKSKSFFQTSLNKNLQMKTNFFNSIFEKDEDASNNDEDVLIDENDRSQSYDYSVDFDIEKLNKINFNQKLNGTILKELEDVNEEDEIENERISSSTSTILSEDDYGGEATPI